jgi:ABC-type nitrate/sulfonate/bicarbonate transport system ATPase subunit
LSNEQNILQIKNVYKYYELYAGAKKHVLDDINFTIKEDSQNGQIISILAPFGSGKSTLLRILSGLEKPSAGEVLYNGNKYRTELQKIVFIPELPSSFPWLNVKNNITFTEYTGRKKYIEKDIAKIISLVGLSGYESHFPDEGSLGFRFRISLARALMINPKFILIDDPFKNLDSETRTEIYSVVNLVCRKFKIVFILTTTNISEALKLSSSIFLMKKDPGTIFHRIELDRNKFETAESEIKSKREEIESIYKTKNLNINVSFSV